MKRAPRTAATEPATLPAMQELALIDRLEAATALLHPMRISLLQHLAEPRTCSELGRRVDATPQKVHYHVKVLEDHGLVRKVDERRVRGIMEGIYQATAHSYWLAPELVGRIGGRRQAADRMSLGFLLDLADRLRSDIGALVRIADSGEHVPTLGMSAQVELPDAATRQAFMEDLQAAIQELARKYGHRPGVSDEAAAGHDVAENEGTAASSATGSGPSLRFELAVACYPGQRHAADESEPEGKPAEDAEDPDSDAGRNR